MFHRAAWVIGETGVVDTNGHRWLVRGGQNEPPAEKHAAHPQLVTGDAEFLGEKVYACGYEDTRMYRAADSTKVPRAACAVDSA